MTMIAEPLNVTADQIKEQLRHRHPAVAEMGKKIPGQWVVLEEFARIDLLALDAWRTARVVGYEVKVSRSDLRSELLDPTKRMEAVSRTTEFYIAAPSGMLSKDEISFDEPDWSLSDFERPECPGVERHEPDHFYRAYNRHWGGKCHNPRIGRSGRRRRRTYVPTDPETGVELPKGYLVCMPVPAVLKHTGGQYVDGECVPSHRDLERAVISQGYQYVRCPACGGKGCSELSRVEQEAPILWIPKDVGLIEIYPSGALVVRKPAPKRKDPKTIIGDKPSEYSCLQRQAIADIVRWASWRPDQRHR